MTQSARNLIAALINKLRFTGSYRLKESLPSKNKTVFLKLLKLELLKYRAQEIQEGEDSLTFRGGWGAMGLALNWSRLVPIDEAVLSIPKDSSEISFIDYSYMYSASSYIGLGIPIYSLIGIVLMPFPDGIGFLWFSILTFVLLRFRGNVIKSRFLGIITQAEDSYLSLYRPVDIKRKKVKKISTSITRPSRKKRKLPL